MRKSNFKELDTDERRSVQREKIKIYIYVINHIREREKSLEMPEKCINSLRRNNN